jgi:hypothetical protein
MTKVGTKTHLSKQLIFMKQLKAVVKYLKRGIESVSSKTSVIFNHPNPSRLNHRKFNQPQLLLPPELPAAHAVPHYGILIRVSLLVQTILNTKTNGTILQ